MIGQDKNKEQVEWWRKTNTFPRTIILSGMRGCGKRMFASYTADQLGFDIRWVGNKVNDVRDMISDCRSLSKPTMFVFVGADDMSLSAKNSLLKVTEEPPNDAYFVIPLEDVSSTLPTIKSRSIEIQMEPYTREQLAELTDSELCLEIARCPGEIVNLEKVGVEKLVETVDKVIDYIYDVSCGNALHIAKNIQFKDGDDGYDLEVFWRVLVVRLADRLIENAAQYSMEKTMVFVRWMSTTQHFLNRLNNTSLNRKMLFDMWVMDIRGEVK